MEREVIVIERDGIDTVKKILEDFFGKFKVMRVHFAQDEIGDVKDTSGVNKDLFDADPLSDDLDNVNYYIEKDETNTGIIIDTDDMVRDECLIDIFDETLILEGDNKLYIADFKANTFQLWEGIELK